MISITYQDINNANNTIKTIDINGKNYTEVSQRIKAFRMVFPAGRIYTSMVSNNNGFCIFRAEIYADDGSLLGTGTAYEIEGSTYINKRSYIENCVPIDTQILTKNGWKYYYQLKEGEEVLSLNIATKKVEYCKLTKINTYKDKPIVELKTSRFDFRCTPGHKWVVCSQYKDFHKVETRFLTNSLKIVQACRQMVSSSIDGRKLGWLMCDCDIKKTRNGMPTSAEISQSKYVDDIKELFGEETSITKSEKYKDNYVWNISADEVRRVLGRFGVSKYSDLVDFALKGDIEDVKGCYESIMLADGSSRGFSSTYMELIDAVQIMCARRGIATTNVTSRMCKLSTRPIYTLGIKKTDGAYFSEMEIKRLPPQDVWCPTTENGTWIMKQGGRVTLTSNCETSAVGRALGMCGFGIDQSVASADEVINAQDKPQGKTIGRDNRERKEIVSRMCDKLQELGIDAEEYAREHAINKYTSVARLKKLLEELNNR